MTVDIVMQKTLKLAQSQLNSYKEYGLKIPSDQALERFVNGLGVKTDSPQFQIDREVLISVVRNAYLTGMNSKKGVTQ
jgi:hypothetical protein